MVEDKANTIEIKICGLTMPAQALEIAEMGADAIGLVFFAESPRNVSVTRAAEICRAIRGKAKSCGVFVNMDFSEITNLINKTALDVIQLHGSESADYISALKKETGKKVIKVLKNESFATDATDYPADYFLLELGKGDLPGGNAQTWDWQKAAAFADTHPYILAGGLSAENINDAINKARPKAVDLSSAVEKEPGVKDLILVNEFIDKVKKADLSKHNERIF